MMENLLPCPFCGSEALLKVIPPHKHQFVNLPPYDGGAFIECTGCTCAMSGNTSEEVIAAWNRRAQQRQPDVVHGRWVHIKEDGMTVAGKCSNCGYTIFNDSDETNYCPSCGAKMD